MSVFRAANNANRVNSANVNANADAGGRGKESYPINRSRAEPEADGPDGPTEPIGDKRRRERIVWLAVLVAVFALATSAVAVLAAWKALVLVRTMPPVAAPGVATVPQATMPGGKPEISDFAVTYAQEPLRVQVGCSAVLYVDLDEPRSNAKESVSDLRYDSRCGRDAPRLTLGPGAAGGAQIKSADTDAGGCQRAIRTSPLGPGASAEVRKGTVLCVLTAASPASVALVEVTDVGQTGTAGMRATSWRVTG